MDYSQENTFSKTYTIIEQSNVFILIWFLAIYLLIYFIINILNASSDTQYVKMRTSRVFDLMTFLLFAMTITYTFFYYSEEEKINLLNNVFSSIKNFVNSPYSIFSLLLFIFVFYVGIFTFGIPMSYDSKPYIIGFIESSVFILLIVTFIVFFFNSILKIPISDVFSNWISDFWKTFQKDETKEKDKKQDEKKTEDEVFNISNNLYTYEDAKSICKSYGARLATYDEIENAYNNGAEWCNYGWSENQMAFFPTQKNTWTELQKDPSTANNCGRPGINGGYIANPYIRFGVNCYGKRPTTNVKITSRDEIIPKKASEVVVDAEVEFWKKHSDEFLNVNSFNYDKWSQHA